MPTVSPAEVRSLLAQEFTGTARLPGGPGPEGTCLEKTEHVRPKGESQKDVIREVTTRLDREETIGITLHCAAGGIKKYEVHQRIRVGGTVELRETG